MIICNLSYEGFSFPKLDRLIAERFMYKSL